MPTRSSGSSRWTASRAPSRRPSSPTAFRSKTARKWIGDDATALKHFNDAANLDKKYAPAYNDIGYANMGLGKYADAETAFKNYITLIPKNPNPYDSYAEMLMKTGRYDDSIVQYNQALTAMAGAERVFRLIDTKPDWEDAMDAVDLPDPRGKSEGRSLKSGDAVT